VNEIGGSDGRGVCREEARRKEATEGARNK